MSLKEKPVLIVPVRKGKVTTKIFRLFAPMYGHNAEKGTFRLMCGESWFDNGVVYRTVEECFSIIGNAAAKEINMPFNIISLPTWSVGTKVRVLMSGPENTQTKNGIKTVDSSRKRRTLTRTMCEPYSRNGVALVRVVGGGEVACKKCEVVI